MTSAGRCYNPRYFHVYVNFKHNSTTSDNKSEPSAIIDAIHYRENVESLRQMIESLPGDSQEVNCYRSLMVDFGHPTAAQQVLATPDILRIIFARDDEEADHEPELGLTDRDLLNCATVNSAWTHEAILVLWREPQLTLNEVFEDIPPARRQIYANFVRSGFMESWSYEYPTDERNHTIA
ncbi:unnamed protein product [Penicillium bialowiezense]